MSKTAQRAFLLVFLFTLVAFGLRVFQLNTQSFWYDEAFSVYLSHFDLLTITARTAADIQPPLYYYFLNLWMNVAGDSEFSVRFLSLFFGVLTIPLMFATARRLFNGTTGLFAALIATISALYLWYSQEARMYTLITFLGLLSSYALVRALSPAETSRRNWWLTFIIANIAAVYTHYFAFTLIAFQLIYAAWVLLRSRGNSAPHAVRNTILGFLAIGVAFLPWVPFMLNRLGEDASYFRGDLKLDEAIRHVAINFSTGESALEAIGQYIALAWLIVLVFGLIAYAIAARRSSSSGNGPSSVVRHPSSSGIIFSVLYLVVPLVLLFILFSRNPKFNPRYLMLASPGLYLLLAAGLASLWALLSARNVLVRVGAGALLVLMAFTLFGTSIYADNNAYFDPAFTKADFRGVANYISQNAQPDEAIVLTSGHLFPAFDYYYKDAKLPELRLPDEPTLDTDNIVGYPATQDMNRALAGKKGVWLVEWQDEVADPNGMVPMLLSSRGAEQAQPASFWQVKLRHWLFPDGFKPLPGTPEIAHPQEANFQNTFKLLGWDQPQPTPADVGASLRLYWQDLAPTPDDYNVALRIVDENGTFWGKLDRRPAGYNFPTQRWKPGDPLFGDYVATMLPGTPAGQYYATVTMFTQQNQNGLDVLSPNGSPLGKSVKVGPIQILPAQKQPSIVDLKVQHTLSTPLAPFTLLGYEIASQGASTGESVPLTLFWRADSKPAADYTFQIQFGDKWSTPLPLANATTPTSQWNAGDIVRGQYLVQIPPDASASNGSLQLKLSGGGGEQTTDLQQQFAVTKTDRTFTAPQSQFQQDANFNNAIALIGYNLSSQEIKAGDPFTVTLDWKSTAKVDKPYTVFVHLLDKDSKPQAQHDGQPMNGGRPTQTWVPGEYLTDPYAIEIKPDVPPGTYTVEIGLYDSADPAFARLPVIDAQGNPAGDHVVLNQTVTIK